MRIHLIYPDWGHFPLIYRRYIPVMGPAIALHNIKNVSLREAVTSPLFKKIQEHQKANSNLLRSCMIIDQPHVYRDVCKMPGVYFTHQGAENIVEQFSVQIDEYAASYGELAEKAWDELSAGKN